MADANYLVRLAIEGDTRGLDLQIEGLSRVVNTLHGGVNNIRHAFEGVVESAAKFTAMVGSAVAVAGLHQIYQGVVGINAEMDKARFSFATIFTVKGVTSGMEEGLTVATDKIGEMRKLARELPGEFTDLQEIFKHGLTPGLQSGANVDSIIRLSAQAMVAGDAMGMAQDMVAREFGQLMAGRSGAHNRFGALTMGLTGDEATEFNKLSGEDRLARIEEALGKYQQTIEKLSGTWGAQTSTLKDNLVALQETVTRPLFNVILDRLRDINAWFDKNRDKITEWANHLGTKLVEAWMWGERQFERWWPTLETFADNAQKRLSEIWETVGPAIDKAFSALEKWMNDPKALDTIESLLKLYGASKVAGPMADVAMGAGQAALGVYNARTIAAAASGAAGGGGPGGGAAAGGSAAWMLVPVAIAGAGFLATEYAKGQAATGDSPTERWNHTVREMTEEMKAQIREDNARITELRKARDDAEWSLIKAIGGYLNNMDYQHESFRAKLLRLDREDEEKKHAPEFHPDRDFIPMGLHAIEGTAHSGMGEVAKSKDYPDAKGVRGRGGTSIQKVEIVITTNQDPSRIARLVKTEIVNLARSPRASKDVDALGASTPDS